ncbi:MAG: citrate synthase [Chitinispirillales bacterium]|jgi:citrate synthase|nr:citrate synthase [Chitinispirillales bacterium]
MYDTTKISVGKAKLEINGKVVELPIIQGSDGGIGVDISTLHKQTRAIAFDNGFSNSASALSAITYIDGENGILRYRGYSIEDLVHNATFREVAYLMISGKLPTLDEAKHFSVYLTEHSMIDEDMHHFFAGFPRTSHPMAILAAMVTSLSSFYPEIMHDDANFNETAARLISKVRTIAAFSYKKSKGLPLVYPQANLSYVENFLNMMFDTPSRPYDIKSDLHQMHAKILDKLLILHADHGQNCSTTAVKLVSSARVNLYAAISAGICALWGPLHGGANQAVIEMLENIKKDGGNIEKYIERAKNKDVRLMGFGHALYKNYDPRAALAKELLGEFLGKCPVCEPLFEIAQELEQKVLADDYFIERKLFPNIDFYTGIIYRALGIPTNMLTVMFVLGRLPGWIAQWRELMGYGVKIFRPRQIYIGPDALKYVPLKNRK